MQPTAVDLFAGAGGATQGLRDAGFNVVGAVEFEQHPAASYALNHPDVRLWQTDIRSVSASSMRRQLAVDVGELTLLKACPPCQGFSSLLKSRGLDPRNELVLDVMRFVRAFRPRSVLIENVPGLRHDWRFAQLQSALTSSGYAHAAYVVDAAALGVPQRRRRLVLVALRGLRRKLPMHAEELLFPDGEPSRTSVRTAFASLPGQDAKDPLARSRPIRGVVGQRIAAVPINGTRFELPDDLQLRCHKALDADNKRVATSSYGRMRLDDPAPTMTTRCTTPACGAFIHPTESRGITLREAATLQTFPHHYQFVGGYDAIERQIGNAVPVHMARVLGSAVLRQLNDI